MIGHECNLITTRPHCTTHIKHIVRSIHTYQLLMHVCIKRGCDVSGRHKALLLCVVPPHPRPPVARIRLQH